MIKSWQNIIDDSFKLLLCMSGYSVNGLVYHFGFSGSRSWGRTENGTDRLWSGAHGSQINREQNWEGEAFRKQCRSIICERKVGRRQNWVGRTPDYELDLTVSVHPTENAGSKNSPWGKSCTGLKCPGPKIFILLHYWLVAVWEELGNWGWSWRL